eukprot:1172700-Prymnesium_polylepis.1
MHASGPRAIGPVVCLAAGLRAPPAPRRPLRPPCREVYRYTPPASPAPPAADARRTSRHAKKLSHCAWRCVHVWSTRASPPSASLAAAYGSSAASVMGGHSNSGWAARKAAIRSTPSAAMGEQTEYVSEPPGATHSAAASSNRACSSTSCGT